MTATRIIDDHLELANIGTNSHAQIDTHIAAADDYIKRDGSLALTSDWDIGDTRKVLADEIRARDGAGLKLYDDNANGIFVKDGGNVGVGAATPPYKLTVNTPTITDKPADVVITASAADHSPLVIFTDDSQTANPFRILTNSNAPRFEVHPNGTLSLNSAKDSLTNILQYFIKNEADDIAIGMTVDRGRGGAVGGVGMGVAHLFRLENGAGNQHDAGKYSFGWADPSSGSEDAYFAVETMENGSFVEGLRVVGGNVGIGTATQTAALDINSDILRLRTAKTPASAGAAGNTGDMGADANYIYRCVSTNSWKRAALNVW